MPFFLPLCPKSFIKTAAKINVVKRPEKPLFNLYDLQLHFIPNTDEPIPFHPIIMYKPWATLSALKYMKQTRKEKDNKILSSHLILTHLSVMCNTTLLRPLPSAIISVSNHEPPLTLSRKEWNTKSHLEKKRMKNTVDGTHNYFDLFRNSLNHWHEIITSWNAKQNQKTMHIKWDGLLLPFVKDEKMLSISVCLITACPCFVRLPHERAH